MGWLSRGIGWYGFHDAILFNHDDPPSDRIFRYFLNILSLGSCFQDTKMRNSGGGRAIFSEFQVELFPWLDDCMAMDIDTPEDY
jgi:hypothetical protein